MIPIEAPTEPKAKGAEPEPKRAQPQSKVQKVIEDALRSAGLMK